MFSHLPKKKSLSTFLVIYFGLLCLNMTKAQEQLPKVNLVSNGTFESVVAPNYPAQWKNTRSVFGKALYQVKAVDALATSSKNSLVVTVLRNPVQGSHSIYQTNIKLKRNAHYKLSFKSLTQQNTGNIKVKLVDSVSKKDILQGPTSFSILQSSQVYTIDVNTPSEDTSSSYMLIFQFNGPNKTVFLLDDIELYEISTDTTSTVLETVSPFKAKESTTSVGIPAQTTKVCNLYVSAPTGNDDNNGSAAFPFKTIGKAISVLQKDSRNKSICVDSGEYRENILINNLRGTKEAPYIIRPKLENSSYVIDGNDMTLPVTECLQQTNSISESCLRTPLVGITDSEFVIVDGMEIKNSSGVGLRLARNANINIINTQIYDNLSFGVLITESSYKTVLDKLTLRNNFKISTIKDIPQGAGMSLYSIKPESKISDIIVTNSEIYDNYGDGVFIGPNTQQIIFEKNYLYDNSKSNLAMLNSQQIRISKNLLSCSPHTVQNINRVVNKGSSVSANITMESSVLPFSDSGNVQNLFSNNILYNCGINLLFHNRGATTARNTFINNTFIAKGAAEQVEIIQDTKSVNSNSFVNNLFLQDSVTRQPQFLSKLASENIFNRNLLLATSVTAPVSNDAFTILSENVETMTAQTSKVLDANLLKMPLNSKAINYGRSSEMLPKDDYFTKERLGQVDAGAIESENSSVLGASASVASSQNVIPQSQCTLFVNKDGNDTDGKNLSNGFKTIQKGIQNLSNEDVLCIKGGSYEEVVNLNKKFKSDTKVKIGAYSGGGAVLIVGGTNNLPSSNCANFPNLAKSKDQTSNLFNNCQKKALIVIDESSFVELIGFTVSESSSVGIYIDDSNNIFLNSIRLTKNGLHGVLVTSSDSISVSDSYFSENNFHKKKNAHVKGTGMDVFDGSKKINVANSLYTKNYGDGMSMRGIGDIQITDSAFWDNNNVNLYVRNSVKFVLDRNLIFCSSSGLNDLKSALGSSTDYSIGFSYFGISRANSDTNTVSNNLFQGCKSNMILNGEGDNFVRNFNIFNNHFVNARTTTSDKSTSRGVLLLGSNFPNLKFKNNIIYQKDDSIRTVVGYNTKYDFSTNIIYPNTIRTLIAPAFITTDPKLESANSDISPNLDVSKFVPEKNSPAINTADTSFNSDYLKVDYLKKERKNLDIGAFEVQGVSNDDPEPPQTDPDPDPEDDPADPDPDPDPEDDPTDPNDSCDYYWCDDTYDYGDYGSYDDTDYDPYSYDNVNQGNEADPYADYYYNFDYGSSDESAQFGFVFPEDPKEVLRNGSFDLSQQEKGLPAGWFIRTGVDGAVSVDLVQNEFDALAGNALKVQLKRLPSAGRVELFQSQLGIKPGKLYELSFVARSDFGSDFDISLNNSVFPYEVLTPVQYGVDLNPDWREYTGYIKIPETQPDNSNVRLVISFDGAIEDVYFIDKLTLMELVDPVEGDDVPYEDYPAEDYYYDDEDYIYDDQDYEGYESSVLGSVSSSTFPIKTVYPRKQVARYIIYHADF